MTWNPFDPEGHYQNHPDWLFRTFGDLALVAFAVMVTAFLSGTLWLIMWFFAGGVPE